MTIFVYFVIVGCSFMRRLLVFKAYFRRMDPVRCLARVATSVGLERFMNTVPFGSKKSIAMGRKAPADALEALLAALLLIGHTL